jgi:hypothetical protein
MKRAALLLAVGLVAAATLQAQAVPEDSPAARVDRGYLRTPLLRMDPFRHVMIPHWGFVLSGNAVGINNTLSFADVGAIIKIEDEDELLTSDIVNIIGLIPEGSGAEGNVEAQGEVYLGGPIGGRFSIGITAAGRAYGTFLVDDDAVALLRDGNSDRQLFDVGETAGTGLGTAELGGHAVLRFGPLSSQDGAHLDIGIGGRYIRPVAYVRESALINEQNQVLVGLDTVAATVSLDVRHTDLDSLEQYLTSSIGSGFATDFLLRLSWPTSGFALEAMVANIGSVTIQDVEYESFRFNVETTSLEEFADSLDVLCIYCDNPAPDDVQFVTDSIAETKVTLPRIVRLSASAWANRILQLDVAATIPAGGEFEMPLAVDLYSTWRLVNSLPLRFGLALGGHHGIGYTAGFGVETRSFYLQAMGGSYGGLFKNARGAAGLFELGVFF